MAWEIVFMLVILKIPIVYLCVVVWWAIKAEPAPPNLADQAVAVGGAQQRALIAEFEARIGQRLPDDTATRCSATTARSAAT